MNPKPPSSTGDGPTLETYVETRFNLLIVATNEAKRELEKRLEATERTIEQRIVAVVKDVENKLGDIESSMKERFTAAEDARNSLKDSILVGQETAKRAVDKAEQQQNAINLASNEWRGTLNDFKSTLVGRDEFDKLYGEFTAYRLEVARLLSATAAEKSAVKEVRIDTRQDKGLSVAHVGMIVAILAVLVSIGLAFVRSGPVT